MRSKEVSGFSLSKSEKMLCGGVPLGSEVFRYFSLELL